jgi:hypothetical protein
MDQLPTRKGSDHELNEINRLAIAGVMAQRMAKTKGSE